MSLKSSDQIIVLDYGSQYSRLITRRIRELGVYSELLPFDSGPDVCGAGVKGIVLSGGPRSVFATDAPVLQDWVLKSGLPVLGICYGMQLLTRVFGGKVQAVTQSEFGNAKLNIDSSSPLFAGLTGPLPVWMSHGTSITELPQGFKAIASTPNTPYAAISKSDRIVGIQFHPEVSHTKDGSQIISNFLFRICGAAKRWQPKNFVANALESIGAQVGDGHVLCAVSGGVDSTVAATLLAHAIGDRLHAVFVDNGLLRRGESDRVRHFFKTQLNIPLNTVDATDLFLKNLHGISDPERKRKVIGKTFVEVFENWTSELKLTGQGGVGKGHQIGFLGQGTTYPDVIESGTTGANLSHKIKTHHNVGGLPKNMRLKVVEPLRLLFKDEVRKVGLELGIPEQMVNRHAFPGPGLAVRIIGAVTKAKLEALRACDWIVMDEVKRAGLYTDLWQCFAVLTSIQSVGVTGDQRAYGGVVAVRAVNSSDGMTANWARLPYAVLESISLRITNEVAGINRVVYDITSKPPGTIEWE